MHDMLHITPTFQGLLHTYREKHTREDMLHLHAQRQAIIDIILARFPVLERLALQQVSASSNAAFLATFATRLVLAYDEQEAKLLLLSIHPAE